MLTPPQQINDTQLPEQTPMDGASETQELSVLGADQDPDSASIVQELEVHLNRVPDQDKQFLAEHLTPEFVRAIGIINGPEVAEYLNQFADPEKVLVPVPRAVAEEHFQQQMSAQGAAQQPQGGLPPTQPAPAGPMSKGFVPPSNPQRLPS